MKLRVARHTSDLEIIKEFYCNLLGLKLLGEFNSHDDYDGIFLGMEGLDWHLEFTTSLDQAQHVSDVDDLLVFYTESEEEYNSINDRFNKGGTPSVEPKNPYWLKNAMIYLDPDGFRVVISKPKQ